MHVWGIIFSKKCETGIPWRAHVFLYVRVRPRVRTFHVSGRGYTYKKYLYI